MRILVIEDNVTFWSNVLDTCRARATRWTAPRTGCPGCKSVAVASINGSECAWISCCRHRRVISCVSVCADDAQRDTPDQSWLDARDQLERRLKA